MRISNSSFYLFQKYPAMLPSLYYFLFREYMQDSYLHAWKSSRKPSRSLNYIVKLQFPLQISPSAESNKDERKSRKGKGKRRSRNRGKSTTPFNPEHTVFTNGYTSTLSTTEDPCTTTHLGYCIHGYCKHIEGLKEPVCMWVQHQLYNIEFNTRFLYAPIWTLLNLSGVASSPWLISFFCQLPISRCMKGYDGERCGIQTLETKTTSSQSNTELLQMVLVIIAVVLSVISCTAILLMTCAQ